MPKDSSSNEGEFASAADEVVLRVGNIALNTQTNEVSINSTPIYMEERLKLLLGLFMKNMGFVVSHEEIDAHITTDRVGYTHVRPAAVVSPASKHRKHPNTNRVNVAVANLKTWLRDNGAHGYYIKNTRKRKYRRGGYAMSPVLAP